jgi:hypothetical protein
MEEMRKADDLSSRNFRFAKMGGEQEAHLPSLPSLVNDSDSETLPSNSDLDSKAKTHASVWQSMNLSTWNSISNQFQGNSEIT